MKACVEIGVRDLLQVSETEHVDVRLEEPAVRNGSADGAEIDGVECEVQLEEVVLPGRAVGPPDDIESFSAPVTRERCERAERIGNGKGKVNRVLE